MAKTSTRFLAPPAPPKIDDQNPTYLPWPQHQSDLGVTPRKFRVHRIDSFAWQAFVTDEEGEQLMGKPDVFDIVMQKIKGVMRAEGQAEFLDRRAKEAAKKINE